MAISVDSELLCKITQIILRTELTANILEIVTNWSVDQSSTEFGFDVPAHAIEEFGVIEPTDILIGRVDAIPALAHFPAIQIFVEEETAVPDEGFEQEAAAIKLRLIVRVIVQGVTTEHTELLLYRYTKAVKRTMMQNSTLKGFALNINPPKVFFTIAPEDPLFKASQLEFEGDIIDAW